MRLYLPQHPFCTLLALGAAGLACAETSSLQSNPTEKDLAQPAVAATKTTGTPPDPSVRELKLVEQFDQDGDHQLNQAERQAARAYLAQLPPVPVELAGIRPRQPTPVAVALEPVQRGEHMDPSGVPDYSSRPLYDPTVVRTLFVDFEENDWEAELAEFARTDVFVGARLTMDGRTYPGVGVHARPLSASAQLPAGYKRSLDLALDYSEPGRKIGGQRQLRLLAATTDPTFLRTMLYGYVARDYLPAPRSNFVRLVINGEYWGIYVSVQPLDENFIQETFSTKGGAYWSVTGGANLAYLGDQPDAYRGTYRLESAEDPAAWARLAELCKSIGQAAPGQFEETVDPLLDLDGVLKFFALENALINQSGYGSSDGSFGLYLDPTGRFHLIPQEAEASLRLVQVNEYGQRPRGEARDQKEDGKAKPAKTVYDRKNFPKKSDTDLAMLLSYSFVNKADADFDGKVSREEWQAFARAWFFAMDEDQTGFLTHDQFITKVRQLVSPSSITDGKTHQTFGKDDPAALMGNDLFPALDGNHDGQVSLDEFTGQFDRWFTVWSDPKTKTLTQPTLQLAFANFFSRSVFGADQSYIATREAALTPEKEEERGGGRGGHGGRGGRSGGGEGGSGLNLGPLHLGGHGRSQDRDSRTLLTYSVELVPLSGLDDATRPLLARLLAAPALRARYLGFMGDITEKWLTWKRLGPVAKEYHELIAADVRKDTHMPSNYEKFVQEFDQDMTAGGRDGDAAPSLKNFIEERGTYLRKDDSISGRSEN